MRAQVIEKVGVESWVAHGIGSSRAISKSKSRNRIATEEESD